MPTLIFLVVAVAFLIGIAILAVANKLFSKPPKPGDVFVLDSQADNPFKTGCDYITIIEVSNGWVKYHFTRSTTAPTSSMYSMSVERLNMLYTKVEG